MTNDIDNTVSDYKEDHWNKNKGDNGHLKGFLRKNLSQTTNFKKVAIRG